MPSGKPEPDAPDADAAEAEAAEAEARAEAARARANELRRKLARRGIQVTQATVSRDIEELGLVKTRSGYRLPDAAEPPAPVQPTLQVILKEFLREAGQASNLVVLKTYPGNAHSVAAVLDAQDWPEVVGTVAGDDTIICIIKNQNEAQRMLGLFKSY